MAEPTNEIDILNRQGVGTNGDHILILNPARRMTKEQALVHAAWLVALADEDDQFPEILKRVQNT